MRVSVLNLRSDILLRGAALGLIAGIASGCSSDFSRFAPTSSDYTGSINQRQIINKQLPPANQAFPDQVPAANNRQEQVPLYNEPVYSGAVQSDGTIRPVSSSIQRKALPPVAAARAATIEKLPAPSSPARKAVSQQAFPEEIAAVKTIEPVTKAKAKALKVVEPIDETMTGGIESAKPVITAAKDPKIVTSKATEVLAAKTQKAVAGTSGGTIKVTSGQTISGIAARYGVPASAILAANGMSSPNELKIDQKLIIPGTAAPKMVKPVSMAAVDTSEEKSPAPIKAPVNENVAVLPTTPQVRSKQTAEVAATSNVDKPGFKVISKKSDKSAQPEQPEAAPVKVAAKVSTKASNGSYAVASGDSLYTIAKRNGTTVDALKAANGLADGKLKIGQELKIPAAGAMVAAAKPAQKIETQAAASAVVAKKTPVEVAKAAPVEIKKVAPAETAEPVADAKSSDKIETAAIKPDTASNKVIEDAEKDTAEAPGSTGISKLRWPVRGRTLVGYGQADAGKANDGIDISVPNGTPVKAAENGVVIYAGTGLKDFGNTVLVRHDNGLVTVYGHNGAISVKRGQTVKRGQELAKSGMSGNTKVPKLHFEVRKNSTPINPATELE